MRWATLLLLSTLVACERGTVSITELPLALDREERVQDQPLTSSTQSVNRYRSSLQGIKTVDVQLDRRAGRLRLLLRDAARQEQVGLHNLDLHFVVPLLAYPHGRHLDDFDRVNLMLAEYSRNGVELALEERNSEYAYVRPAAGLFNEGEEYAFAGGKVVPNPGARPKRMSVVNNCLFPGLWEVNAVDSVGEMFHGWFSLPEPDYFKLVRAANRIDAADPELKKALGYVKQLPDVALDLDRLRAPGRAYGSFPLAVNLQKPIASYSTQDSRRKVQRHFYRVERDGAEVKADTFAGLRPGDLFRFHSFVPPGVYTPAPPRLVPYAPIWTRVELTEVTPRTRFLEPSRHGYPLGALELVLRSADGQRALVLGNLPIDLLVFQEDYDIPGFGVGVLRASEPVEKRHLFFAEGPAPVYAYLARQEGERLLVVNNHDEGLEQIYLRPVRKDGQVYLRVTLVAYERIVDILEVEVKLPADLADKVVRASASYRRPLWRSFSDTNLL